MDSKKQRTLSWPFGGFKNRNCCFDFTASQLWGQAVQLSESSLFGSTRKYSEQADCKFSLTPALMAEALSYNHRVCGWSERGECACAPGQGGMLPFLGRSHRRSRALIPAAKIIWMLSWENHFSSENCLSSESASVSNIFGFRWWGMFLGMLLFCWNFSKGRLLHFTMTREGKWPSTQCSRCSHTMGQSRMQASTLLSWEQELGLSEAQQRLQVLGWWIIGSGGVSPLSHPADVHWNRRLSLPPKSKGNTLSLWAGDCRQTCQQPQGLCLQVS